jgi:Ca-activated chloride channel family protein
MTLSVTPMSPTELERAGSSADSAGIGALRTERGNLPLDRLDVHAHITGLVGRVRVTTEFVNAYDTALEATYVFPLPDRAAVTGMTMTADGRTVEAELRERGAARAAYDEAVASGRRASIAEEERPDVFTMRVGNILPGERVAVQLRLVGPLAWEDGAATFRFPLVVAPRYVPGTPIDGPAVGDGQIPDTDAVPDASRISPPVLLPGFPNPLRLSIGVDVDPAGLELAGVRSSLHTVTVEGNHLTVTPGERADRDFVLRLPYAGDGSAAVAVPDGGDEQEGTYQLTVVPPETGTVARPRDVVLLLDRSGSMSGWSMVAARRAAARIVDSLTADDRFGVLTFDNVVEHPAGLGPGLVPATDRNRYRAVEHLAQVEARGGTELLAPLRDALRLLGADGERDRVLVLVTDGQVGNEDQILKDIGPSIGRTRVHTVGIDTAVNAGFLGRLAAVGGGRCELVESEDRLDEAMEHIHRRIGAPVVTDLALTADGLSLLDDTRAPARLTAIYPGTPLVVSGRYRGATAGALTLRGRTRDGRPWETTVPVQRRDEPAVTAQWARAHLRDLEDRRLASGDDLAETITATSLRYGVLCRFTAWLAVDSEAVTDGAPHRVVQPVELPAGWERPAVAAPAITRMAYSTPPGLSHFDTSIAAAPSGPLPPIAAAPPSRGAAVRPMGFAPGRMRAAAARPGRARPGHDEDIAALREVARLEATRLTEAGDLPEHERREVLADLVSRLGSLLQGTTAAAYEPLRSLLQQLRGGGDVADLWAAAVRVLTQFGSASAPGATGSGPDRRDSFWRG